MQVCELAAAAEAASEHPLAKAVLEYAEQQLSVLSTDSSGKHHGSRGVDWHHGNGHSTAHHDDAQPATPMRLARLMTGGWLRVSNVEVSRCNRSGLTSLAGVIGLYHMNICGIGTALL